MATPRVKHAKLLSATAPATCACDAQRADFRRHSAMTASSLPIERYRLEIQRTAEAFETHGFFASLALAEEAADGDMLGSGDPPVRAWIGPDSLQRWVAETGGASYRITHECEPVTTAPQYQALGGVRPAAQLTDDQVRCAVQMGLDASPATARLDIDVEVMDHRVFLKGHVHDVSDVRRVEEAAAHVADIGEVVDLLDVECC
jgi:hypothetical protein